MPPRLRLTPQESELLPSLLERFSLFRSDFPTQATATEQARWIHDHYSVDAPLSLNLVTLLLFEHGVHRSLDQVANDIAILREDS